MTDAELAAAYHATTWRVHAPEGDLLVRPADAADASRRMPPALRAAAVVTAYNPASRARPAAHNRAAQRELRLRLQSRGARWLEATALGTGPEADQWTEPSLLVLGLARDALVALAREFGQNAILWIDDAGRPLLVVSRPGFCGLAPGDPLPDPRVEQP